MKKRLILGVAVLLVFGTQSFAQNQSFYDVFLEVMLQKVL